MILELQYAYAALCLPFGIIWIFFYLFSPSTRKKLLVVSCKRAPFGILLDWIYTSDYWSPQSMLFIEIGEKKLMFESMLFAFFLSGIAAVAFKAFFSSKLHQKNEDLVLKRLHLRKLALCYLAAIALMLLVMEFGMNSIYASVFAYSMVGAIILYRKPQLLMCCFFTSIFVSSLLFFVYISGRVVVTNIEDILRSWWFLYGTNLDIRICNIPVTELIWGLGYGFTAGARHNLEIA